MNNKVYENAYQTSHVNQGNSQIILKINMSLRSRPLAVKYML